VIVSVLVHVVALGLGWVAFDPSKRSHTELVDIELAPPPPMVEALPEEVARKLDEQLAASRDELDRAAAAADQARTAAGEGFAIDAGVDAPADAAIDAAPIDARPRKPDAAIDAPEPMVAGIDAGTDDASSDDATELAAITDATGPSDAGAAIVAELDGGASTEAGATASTGDAGATGDATEVAMLGSGAGSAGSGSGMGSDVRSVDPGPAIAAGSGSGSAGMTNEPAVDGAPTTAGTAANLLTYFPPGHVVTALIRFDRLRGTEWAPLTERLLRPMPDYRVLFGPTDAKIADKLDTLVISSPSPRDPRETTLVAHTALGRADLRAFLGATTPVTWSTARGGLLGKRTGKTFPGDTRVFLSPFRNWFLLAKPGDLTGMTAAAPGDLDRIEAKGKLPAWLSSIRTIEGESGDPRGPALVVTLGLGGTRVDLEGNDFGLGIQTLPTPDRVSLAMEIVKQGWLVRGNMRFASQKDAAEFVTAAETARQRIEDSRALQMVMGKPLARVIKNLSFARTGGRVSYATSISIADARAILAATAQQLDQYYGTTP
jgi:hypothetical protein